MGISVNFKIQRYNPEKDSAPYFQEFKVDNVDQKDRVIDVLNKIKWGNIRKCWIKFRNKCS